MTLLKNVKILLYKSYWRLCCLFKPRPAAHFYWQKTIKSVLNIVKVNQCDQIGRLFALWATIQSRWQQLFFPNPLHCWTIFIKMSKSFIFLVKSYLGNFYRYLAIFIWSHFTSPKFCFAYMKSLVEGFSRLSLSK